MTKLVQDRYKAVNGGFVLQVLQESSQDTLRRRALQDGPANTVFTLLFCAFEKKTSPHESLINCRELDDLAWFSRV